MASMITPNPGDNNTMSAAEHTRAHNRHSVAREERARVRGGVVSCPYKADLERVQRCQPARAASVASATAMPIFAFFKAGAAEMFTRNKSEFVPDNNGMTLTIVDAIPCHAYGVS